MKLLLASNGGFLIKHGYDLLGIPKSEMRIAYVTTASKGVESLSYLERHQQVMRDGGYTFEEIDIEGKTKDELYEFFKNKNVVHVEGGNTFYLLKAFRETKFDFILKELVAKGIPYVGSSAGAYIASPTIEMELWKPIQLQHNHYGVTNLAGLNLVPFLLVAHYKEDKKEYIRNGIASTIYDVHVLRDGQGIFVEDGVATFVGEGDEVIL